MKVLLVGGSGHVGTIIAPYLATRHELRVLDLRPPANDSIEFMTGSIDDPETLTRALSGCDTFINLVMNGPQGGTSTEQSIDLIVSNYTVNTLGLHLLLYQAQSLGINYGVHTSTMTVHHRGRTWYGQEEDVPFDTPSVYGLTKGLGEQICQYFARWFDMSIIALRITTPRARATYLQERRTRPRDFQGPLFDTDEEDLARAYLSALEVASVGRARFDAFFIAGDEKEQHHNLTKARRQLDWGPQSQRYLDDAESAGRETTLEGSAG